MATPPVQHAETQQRRAFIDIDEQASCLEGYDQRYIQIGRGPYAGAFSTAVPQTGGLVHLEETNRTLLQQGGVPRDTAAVGFLMASSKGRSVYNGVDLDGHSVVLLAPGDSFDVVLGAGARFCVVEVPRNGSTATEAGRPSRVVRWGGDPLTRLRDWAAAQLQAGTEPKGLPCAAEWVGEIARQARAALRPSDVPRLNAADRHRLCRTARDWMEAHADTSVSIEDLCRSIGASRRAVEYAFETGVGAGPSAFLKVLRLNRVRRDLIAACRDRPPIGDVAARWGLWHPSRFAAEYRSLFGELPSQTLQRHGRRIDLDRGRP